MSFFLIFLAFLLALYIGFYLFLSREMKKEENSIVDLFLKKAGKVPALVEVMRPYVDKKEAFARLIEIHTEVMIESTRSIYDILEHNMRLQDQFSFLMKLSMQIPELQKQEYFVYIRDFIIEYERVMRSRFKKTNAAIARWNKFVMIKNYTGIGFFLPGKDQAEII